jgi:aminoglycoside/choline kinase family phosphotransferase
MDQTVLPDPLLSLEPASADASFRRYFRATTAAGSFVVDGRAAQP